MRWPWNPVTGNLSKSATDLPFPRAMTSNWAVVFLVAYWIWIFLAQRFLPPILIFQLVFMLMTIANLWWGGNLREAKSYFVGRLLPIRLPVPMALVFFSILVGTHYGLVLIQPGLVKQPTFNLLLFTPVTEEIVFRGILLTILLSHATAPRWAMILLAALLFAGCHVIEDPWRLLGLTISGLIYGYALVLTRSIPFCVACHMLKNAMTCCAFMQNNTLVS